LNVTNGVVLMTKNR